MFSDQVYKRLRSVALQSINEDTRRRYDTELVRFT
jgi:hypothetical protein